MTGAEHTCAACPKMCRFACPVARARASDAVHPTGLATAVVQARAGGLPWEEAGRVVYACTTCLGCNTPCELDQDVPAWLLPARAEAVERGAAPGVVMEIGRRAAAGSPYAGEFATTVGMLVKEALQTETSGEADVAYVPSCTTVARQPEIALAVIAVLQSADVTVRVVQPGCCGGAFNDLGHVREAERLTGEMHDAIARARAKRVITDGPLCASTLDATPFAVFAAELIDAGRLRPRKVSGRVVYHDPCLLSRRLGVTDPPRRVLDAVFSERIEPHQTRSDGRCSGGGGGLPATDPDASRAIAAERLDELRATGADIVVSACPRCKVQFGGGGMPVRDIAEVLASAL